MAPQPLRFALANSDNVGAVLGRALEAGAGILRLAPNWVPRSFLRPGRRLRLHPDDWFAYGADRGGIDERWLASTTEAENEGRLWHEGLSFCVFAGEGFLLRDAVAEAGATLIGQSMYSRYNRWPVLAKFFDNMGPIPLHMHQGFESAALVGREAKPEAYYFPPQMNNVDNEFPYTFMGLEPGTTKQQVKRCLNNWNLGDNGVLDLSRAYRLQRGTGWLIPPGVLHAPGTLCTYEPQWGSDVFAMYQSELDGKPIPWEFLVKDMPPERHADLDFIVEQLDWDRNTSAHFKQDNFLQPIIDDDASGDGVSDRWVVYGTIDGRQLFSAKELTLQPGAKTTLRDPGASGWIAVQGRGRIGPHSLGAVSLLRFGEMSEDEFFISHQAAVDGVVVENTGADRLVALRHFGPDVHAAMPDLNASHSFATNDAGV